MEDTYLIRWKDKAIRPENARYVLLKLQDSETAVFCVGGAYENGRFWLEQVDAPVEEGTILGWSYYPYEECEADSL